ncbi:NAD-dependent epimerase/dehydratase family protein [Serratia marcescens]|uniref:NAD-dependent epimerase/dehydratase family protein n=1 Tax=Serratia marcescens TaxID=615 RepID=UPI00149552A8|nr:NAD-dependent epimerase/dehydratase family protein [Serratia marcescens]
MSALVIGGNGFIGSRLVAALRTRGEETAVLDRFPARTDMDWAGVRYFQGDFHDADVLGQALQDVDSVYHLASCTVPSTADADPIADIEGNLIGTHRLLEAMRVRGVRRLCYFSSGGTVYGNPDTLPVPETHALRPISSYGIVKVAIEHYLTMFQRQGWLDPVIIRPSNPYGPGQSTRGIQGAVAVFLGRALAGLPVEIWGDGETVRDYVFIDDLIDLALLATESGRTGVFNAASGNGISLNELCAAIRVASGRALPVQYKPGRTFDVRSIVLDVQRAKQLLGWTPKIALAEGLILAWRSMQDATGS